jgi:hypothetical protein
MQPNALQKRIEKYNIQSEQFTEGLKLATITQTDNQKLKVFYLTWYSVNKSYPLGKLIGEQLTCDQIPKIYKVVIKKAKQLVQNV